MDANKLPKDPTLVALIREGKELKSRVVSLIENWPPGKNMAFCELSETSLTHQEEVI